MKQGCSFDEKGMTSSEQHSFVTRQEVISLPST